MTESNLRRGMIVYGGDWTQFLTRPISAVLLAMAAIFLALVFWQNRKSKHRDAAVNEIAGM